MEQRRSYRVNQDGMTVASAEGPENAARMTIMRYADLYEQDGPIEIQEKVSKRWKTIYSTPTQQH